MFETNIHSSSDQHEPMIPKCNTDASKKDTPIYESSDIELNGAEENEPMITNNAYQRNEHERVSKLHREN